MDGDLMRTGARWYKREPQAYLGGVQGLTAKQHAVYSVVLDLIYEHGGSINCDPRWIAGWISDMGPAAVRTALGELEAKGKIALDGGIVTQKRALKEAVQSGDLSAARAEAGRLGGIASGIQRQIHVETAEQTEIKRIENFHDNTWMPSERRADTGRDSNKNNDLAEASAEAKRSIDKTREDKRRKKEEEGAGEADLPQEGRGLLADLFVALGVDAANPPPYWTGPGAEAHVAAWIELGLTGDHVIDVARASREKMPEPPDGPKALDKRMAQAATALASAASVSAAPAKAQAVPDTSTPEQRLAWFAERINSNAAFIPPSMITNTTRDQLLHAGLVTREALREKGIAV